MKIFILSFVFIVATMLPILFIPLFILTVLAVFIVGPYISAHTRWFDDGQQPENTVKH
jgi:hypothetical protein